MYRHTRVAIDWVVALSVYALTLLIIPISDKLLGNLAEDTADFVINTTIEIAVALVFLVLLAYLIQKGKNAKFISYLWYFALLSITVYFLSQVEITRDRMHFVGYGILSLCLYRALRHNIATKMLYFWASFFIVFFAALDECLQLSGLGGRALEWKDITIDWLSGLVGLAIIAFVVRPKLESAQIKIQRYSDDLKKMKSFEADH